MKRNKKQSYKLLLVIMMALSLFGSSCSSQKTITTKSSGFVVVEKHKVKNSLLYDEATSWLGTPYKYGGQSRKGTDCSGMVVEIFKKVYGVKLYRSSYEIFEKNCKQIKKKELQEGDLVFFVTSSKGNRINHVGIYLYDDCFIHASTKRGVIISRLSEPYYDHAFKIAGRVPIN